MPFQLFADFVVLIHLSWILFLIFGAIPSRRFSWVKWIHLGALSFSLVLQTRHWICPLTHLEVWLRNREDPLSAFQGTFIGYYAEKIVYLEVSEAVVLAGTVGIAVFSGAVYLWPNAKRSS